MSTLCDIIIIGGGPAGMTAAIYGARANLRTAILERRVCGGLVNTTHVVENFPSHSRINGEELMEKVRDQVESLGVAIHEVVEIESVSLAGDIKTVVTDEGEFSAPVVILATGRTPKPLPVETDCEQVHYCAICDGSAYKGRSVLVVGGGNSGVEESLYLLSLGVDRIVLIEEMDHLLASESAQQQLTACSNVEIMTSTRIQEIRDNGRLERVFLYDAATDATLERQVDGIFVYIGQEPKTDLFEGQVDLDPAGYVLADEDRRTSLPGVFAAGDVVGKKYRQIVTAVSDGAIAALAAVEYLTDRKQKCLETCG